MKTYRIGMFSVEVALLREGGSSEGPQWCYMRVDRKVKVHGVNR